MDSMYFAFGVLCAAYAGGYFRVHETINAAILNHDYVSALPILIGTLAIGLLAHHQRQSQPLPRE